ncbi:ALG3-domain-containing protein [Morchella conica CCBAS932]|uniref:Dol-P-Man:Man(5)GlcNAc(2)-PP-Dol alpha-1,3-mannosyltransferase n=1 Tax=Morchella conica CCBAS932 TaxID=1392247 RepID=A0A3N4KEM2_9PEZI|nr:ALG3-domain-containing protein [Morchella conica CCBAS932]
MDIIRSTYSFAFSSHSRLSRWLLCPLLFAEAFLCTLIIKKVPYTEIDWKAYMEQVAQYQAGERDYALIKGGTGPLVYPAGHVYIYSFLSDLTHQGADIVAAQYLFMGLYLATLAMVFMVYREARAPVYILPLLALSKRLHSIYLLRLFNDPFSIFLLFAAIYCWQKRQWTLGSAAYSLSVGVKMNTLLALPAVAVIYLLACGRDKAIKQAVIMAQIQFLLGTPFLGSAPKSYITKAFEFSRQFMFKWTVNWRFVGEETFLSREFSLGLLAVHAVLLFGFILHLLPIPPPRPRHGPRRPPNLAARQPAVHTHLRAHGQRDRHAVCALAALPVLQLARLGGAVSAVEERAGPALGRRAVGGAGVGVECVSEHE